MNFVCCADIHVTGNKPLFRKDDFSNTLFDKIEWIINFANKNDAILLIAGDLYDSAKIGYSILNKLIPILIKIKTRIIVVPGQHDMLYHSQDLNSTPINTLHLSKIITILNGNSDESDKVFGCGFEGNDPPKNTKSKILIIHKSITPKKPPFFLADAISAKQARKKYKQFKFIVSGDYHTTHYSIKNGIHVINCGSIARTSKDQINHKPSIFLINEEENKVTQHFIPINQDVFDYDKIELMDKSSKIDFSTEIKELIKTINISESKKPKYRNILSKIIKTTKPKKEVEDIISNIMETIHVK